MKKQIKEVAENMQERIFDVWDFISGWLWVYSSCPYRRIRHIIGWIPFLWNDYDWDYQYILRMQREKLRRTRECIQGNDIIADANKVCKEIRIAELLLTRLIDDEYGDYYWEEYDREFITFETKERRGDFILHTRQNSDEGGKHLKEMTKKIAALKRQDLEYLGRYTAKHILGWWE